MTGWYRRLRARIRYRRFQDDLVREIETHRELRQAALEAGGLPPEMARRHAARDLGNVTLAVEDSRGVWIAPWLQGLWQDARYALTTFRRQPVFGLSAVLVLALGIGLVTALFSFAHATFLRPWQVPHAESVVLVRSRPTTTLPDFRAISIAEYRYLRAHARSLSHLSFSVRSSSRTIADAGSDLGSVRTIYVSASYFDTLQIGPPVVPPGQGEHAAY